jgi:NAD(P)-dependent dehydrogenase (short-subunit alcohol dehydrogenase family)
MRLKDKHIIVTGSTTGVGEAIARKCVAEGAHVLIHGLEQDLADKVAGELGDAAIKLVNDLADPDAPRQIVDHAVAAWGRIDSIVNNAAWVKRADLEQTDAALFDRIMAINVRAPMLLIKAARKHLSDAGGAVINIGSMNMFGGENNLLPYSVSKGALYTLSRNLADALRLEGIRIYHFILGWVLTENEYKYKIADGLPEDWPQRLPPHMIPSGSLLKPEHVANVAAFWLSDEAKPFAGTAFELDQVPFLGRNPTKVGEEK